VQVKNYFEGYQTRKEKKCMPLLQNFIYYSNMQVSTLLYLGTPPSIPTMDPPQQTADYGSDGDFIMAGLESEMLNFPESFDQDCMDECASHYSILLPEYKRLWTENNQLRAGWADDRIRFVEQVKMLELHLEQRQRLLDKQTSLVDILSDAKKLADNNGVEGLEEYTSACDRCAYHRDMWRRLRTMNLEQQKRCEVESANVRSIQHQQGKQLAQIKNQYMQLKTMHEELKRRKDDPFCRDSEICKLRIEVADAKGMTAAYNQTALKANNEARGYFAELEQGKHQVATLQADITALKAEIKLSCERVEVLTQTVSAESKQAMQLFTVGECKDLVCRNRQLGWSHKLNMAIQEIARLKEEQKTLHEDLARARADSTRWRNQCDSLSAVKREPMAAIPLSDVPVGSIVDIFTDDQHETMVNQQVVHVMEQKSKPLVANICRADELTLRLQSLFELIQGWDAEMDENTMYDEFMLDQEPHKRSQIMEQLYSVCHGGNPMPEKERKKIEDNSIKNNRVCKRSFSACLRAIGGVMSKKRSRNVWLNFRQTRAPIFKWCVERV
jgi:hypothetical protein